DHRPLVFRRTRLESRVGRGWRQFEDHRQAVEFEIREGLDAIAIDHRSLDTGLVVVPRESMGTAGDLPDHVPPDLAADTPVRATIHQLSSVEHAIVLGVPRPADPTPRAPALRAPAAGASAPDDPRATMTAGLGRPLVLTVLEPGEAM